MMPHDKYRDFSQNKQIGRIAQGRNIAVQALEEYAAGDKNALANVITAGIRNVTQDILKDPKFDQSMVVNAEMLVRMSEMIQRDPELCKYCYKNGLTHDDMANARELVGLSKVENNYEKAVESYDAERRGIVSLTLPRMLLI